MSTSTITITHSDVQITYNEGSDKWEFTLRGRDRSAESLAKAKEFIDRPLPKEKDKPFQRIPAWLFRYNDEPKKVEITGIAEGRGYKGDEKVWISDGKDRRKESVGYSIYPQSANNDAIVLTILEKNAAAAKLHQEVSELNSKLSPIVLPKDE
jgi:hypothetical protein